MNRRLLLLILLTYALVGSLYAALTPPWQVPDEPAHYNYIRSLATGGGLPVLEPGDYDQARLSRLTHLHFPPEESIASIEYEDHQPPLYYLLATPLYLLFDSALTPLRLLSVALGLGVLLTAYGAVRAVCPERPGLALMTTAFIAFIPQHVAMLAGVENDALAELVVGGTLWGLLRYVGGGEAASPWPIALLLTAALLTKTTTYFLLPLALLAAWLGGGPPSRRVRRAAQMLIPPLLLAAPWFIRNGLVYGLHDPLGLARHNAVVVGQPRSAAWVAEYGWRYLLVNLARTTFHSFWGQFGWMELVLPARLYRGFTLLTVMAGGGFLVWLASRRRPRLTPAQRRQTLLLVTTAGFTLAAFLGYNLTFVQHQGRYLYPALIPLGLAASLGLDWWLGLLPRRWRLPAAGLLFGGLAALDVYCLFRFIVPLLTPR